MATMSGFRLFTVYRRLLLSGGALVHDSARSLMVVFIAYAPPSELMKIPRVHA